MRIPLLALALALGAPSLAGGQALQEAPEASCDRCHGELELLRQHADGLAAARALEVTAAGVAASAHAEQGCADCHTGFARWPHPANASTADCAACHEEAHDLWGVSVHANPDVEGEEPVECADCHGVHDAEPAAALASRGEAMTALNARCVGCHETRGLPQGDPHLGAVSCAACHAPHEIRDVDDPEAWVSPTNQPATCGACHEEPRDRYVADIHGTGLAEAGAMSLSAHRLLEDQAPAVCTSCHGGHGMVATDALEAAALDVERCGACHQDYAETYFGTYHGKATALGSEIVATCDDCHSPHQIEPASDADSWVHPVNLVESCGTCHEHARPAFVQYDSHPDPMDRSRNAPLFYSFVFMNTLLLGVLVVFGLHTLLWWVRILLDRREAEAAGGSHG